MIEYTDEYSSSDSTQQHLDNSIPTTTPPTLSNLLPLVIYERNLPHWQQDKACFFLTFRLADSIPLNIANRIRQERYKWLKHHEGVNSESEWIEYNKLFSERINHLLDAGTGACFLKMKCVSDIVKNSLLHFEGTRYALGEWIIMPNHVHLIVRPFEQYTLQQITHSWKSFTAHKINKLLKRTGRVWQHESYDHIIRNERQLRFIERYILENPRNAKLKSGYQSRYQACFSDIENGI